MPHLHQATTHNITHHTLTTPNLPLNRTMPTTNKNLIDTSRHTSTARNLTKHVLVQEWANKYHMMHNLLLLSKKQHYSENLALNRSARFLGHINPPRVDNMHLRSCHYIRFIDKSHSNLFITLVTTPVSLTLHAYSVERHRKVEYWRNIIYPTTSPKDIT